MSANSISDMNILMSVPRVNTKSCCVQLNPLGIYPFFNTLVPYVALIRPYSIMKALLEKRTFKPHEALQCRHYDS